MKPAAASTNDAQTARTDEQKRALIEEYDAADYKARYAMLDREQITVRDIGRWRVALRAKLTVAKPTGQPATPRAKKKSAASTSPAAVAPVREPARRATARPAPAAPAAAAPAVAPKRAAAASRKSAAPPQGAKKRASRARSPQSQPEVDATATAAAPPARTRRPRSEPARRRPVPIAAPAEPNRRQRRRSGTADAAASALREAALTHADQIVQHARALARMLDDEAWRAVAATTATAADTERLAEQVATVEATGRAVGERLRAAGRPAPLEAATSSADGRGRGRKPWWGAPAG